MSNLPIAVDKQKAVFVVHGRNSVARRAMFTFLRALELHPIEWEKAVALTGGATPSIERVLTTAFLHAQAIVVLFTPDEVVHLRADYSSGDAHEDQGWSAQARVNVYFEAGMAIGRDPDRTVLVELGRVRGFSDALGRHVLQLDDSNKKKNELVSRLRVAGCAVETHGSDWLSDDQFRIPADLSPQELHRMSTTSPSAVAPGTALPVRRSVQEWY